LQAAVAVRRDGGFFCSSAVFELFSSWYAVARPAVKSPFWLKVDNFFVPA
jgi:hypothetical protein